MNLYSLTTAERDTILAALRFYQSGGAHDVSDIAADNGEPLNADQIDGLCVQLNSDGIDQGQALNHFGVKDEHPYVEAARKRTNDNLEIDDCPLISEADNGVWVSAWIWVSNEDAGVEEN